MLEHVRLGGPRFAVLIVARDAGDAGHVRQLAKYGVAFVVTA
jgi:hypothetical protein